MDTITLVYISTYERELHPAIYSLKAYALKELRDKAPRIITKTIHLSKSAYRTPGTVVLSDKERDIITDKILAGKPQIVGFSLYVWNAEASLHIINELKKRNPALCIVAGGAEVSSQAKHLLKRNRAIDMATIDEGEETFAEIAGQLVRRETDRTRIKGLVYRDGNRIITNPLRGPADLRTIPSPYIPPHGGIDAGAGTHTYTVETSRGCPFHCAYCSYNIRAFAKLRYFPLPKVKDELIYLLGKKVKKINIIDDNFNINEKRAMQILRIIRKHNTKTLVTLFIRADVWPLGKKLTKALSHPLLHLAIGVQSLNENTLRIARRTAVRHVLEANLRSLDMSGARYTLQFIIGLPGDTIQDVKNDINWALEYHPEDIHLQVLRINPETFFEKEADSLGLHYINKPPYIITKSATMSPSALRKAEGLNSILWMVEHSRTLKRQFMRLHKETRMPYTGILEQMLARKKGKID